MKKIYFIVVFTFINFITFSQNIGINEVGALPDNSAALDVDFTDKGVLIPRMTTNQRDAIQNPAHSLLIFNTTTDCFNAYNASSSVWSAFGCACISNQAQSDFSWNSTASGQNITFTPNDMTALSYSWTFAQATPGVSNAQVPSNIVWANNGTYNVTLVATFAGGCYTTTKSITIYDMQIFNYTGGQQTFTVPQGVTSVFIEAWGAEGGGNSGVNYWGVGGNGGYSEGTAAVTPGATLYIHVGQAGFQSSSQQAYNGGGRGNPAGGSYGNGFTGGGASHVATVPGVLSTLAGNVGNLLIVAGGGGGCTGASSNNWPQYAGNGGDGGGTIGGDGNDAGGDASYRPGGKGGTQVAGGTSSGASNNAAFGRGADASTSTGDAIQGGGGGGGYYGGGAGAHAGGGGGGGSGYIGGVTNGSMQSGIQSGNGQIIIYY